MTKSRTLTDRQKAFIGSLFAEHNGDYRAAMKAAGYSDYTTIQEAVEPIKTELAEAAALYLAGNAPKAAIGLVNVIDAPDSPGAKNKLAAAVQLLDRVGVVKTEKLEVEASGSAVVLLPPKGSV